MSKGQTDEPCEFCLEVQKQSKLTEGKQYPLTGTGKVLLGIFGFTTVSITAAALPFVAPGLRKICLPFIPATNPQVRNVLSVLKNNQKGRLVDLGSGDGRIGGFVVGLWLALREGKIKLSHELFKGPWKAGSEQIGLSYRQVIEAAKQGYTAVGIELNPWLVLYSRYKAWREGVHRQTSFIRKDMFKVDLQSYDHVVVFGVDTLMDSLGTKLEREVNQDCDIVACRFPFPSWEACASKGEGLDTVWLYKAGHLRKG